MFFYPLIIVYALITGVILFASYAGGEEPFHREEYTIARETEWIDNTKEYTSIVIYKDVKYLPFLYYKIYEEKDYNTSLDKVFYNKRDKTMDVILSNGSQSWIHTINLE